MGGRRMNVGRLGLCEEREEKEEGNDLWEE